VIEKVTRTGMSEARMAEMHTIERVCDIIEDYVLNRKIFVSEEAAYQLQDEFRRMERVYKS